MTNDDKTHRLHVNVDTETFQQFKTHIQWGLRNVLIVAVLKIIVAAVKRDGMIVVGAVLSGKYKLVIDNDVREENAQT